VAGGGLRVLPATRAHPADIVLLVHLETPSEKPRLRGALCCQPVSKRKQIHSRTTVNSQLLACDHHQTFVYAQYMPYQLIINV
jgi:hypothetical protein